MTAELACNSLLEMKHIKPSINVKYTIEISSGSSWEELQSFTYIQKAIDYLEKVRQAHPKNKYRFVRCEWKVID